MLVITERDLIRTVPQRWDEQYKGPNRTPDKVAISKRIRALDLESATAKDVEAAIGNDSWTELKCDECGKYVTWVVQVGEKPDYESNTANLCRECLAQVWALSEGSKSEGN